MHLYKYATAARVDVLLSGLIRFTPAAEFNDPFEVVPHLAAFLPPDQVDAYLSQFAPDVPQMLQEAVAKEVAAHALPPTLADLARHVALDRARGIDVLALAKAILPMAVDHLRPTFGREFQQKFDERYGILSLSGTPTSLLMWAHYADCHRGLVFEFDVTHSFFKRPTAAGAIGNVRQVVYAATRPAIVAYNPSIPVEAFANQLIVDLLLTKGVEWQYEREWRLLYSLNDPTLYPHTVSNGLHLFPISPQAFTAVVLGCRASEATQSAVRAALSGSPDLAHVELRQSRPSDTRYEVAIAAAKA